MDFSDPGQRTAFFEIHRDLPREGPGEGASTRRALALCGALPAAPRVLDIACGPGAQSLDLAAALPDATIVALDAHALRSSAQLWRRGRRGRLLAGRVGTAPWATWPRWISAPASFDLIWCGRRRLVHHGRGGGARASLEAPARSGRQAGAHRGGVAAPGPAAGGGAAELGRISGHGATSRRPGRPSRGPATPCWATSSSPPSAWRAYYGPIEARLDLLESTDHPAALAIRGEARAEIAAWRLYGDWFGYAFFVARL